MPLPNRIVEPQKLGRKALRPEQNEDSQSAQLAVSHNTVLGALYQLASLVRHADDLFCDLAEECQKVFEKTEKINEKLSRVKDHVHKLDSKKVKIPVGNLKQFSKVTDHHVARHGFDCYMFTPDSRPHCIKDTYSLSDVTPTKILRGADIYRKDGLCSSNLFKLWPIVLNDHKVDSPDLSLARKGRLVTMVNKGYKVLKMPECRRTIHEFDLEDSNKIEEEGIDYFCEPSVVEIDTSGASFQRMSSFRDSLRDTSFSKADKKKRRRTVSGVPENVLYEISQFERQKRNTFDSGPRNRPRAYSFDDLDSKTETEKDEILAQYFDEIDAKYEEMLEEENASKEPKIFKFLPCRRSRSLPRCVKMSNRSIERHQHGSYAGSSYASSVSLASENSTGSRLSRVTKRSSIISNKIKSLVNAGNARLRPRPKSLDLDSIELCPENNEESNLRKSTSPSMPANIEQATSSTDSIVGPGTYYYFNSNTIPRTQAKKYDFPWESLPKDWTTSVKLREISKRKSMEERNSSSGAWSASGSSSNRQSLDSAKSSMPSSNSQYSLGKDSGRDSPGLEDRNDTSTFGTETECMAADEVESVTGVKSHFTKMDTDAWLQMLAMKAASREDVSASSAETLKTLSQLTKQNIQALDLMSPALRVPQKLDDEVSSVYSLDQEGFYTSFHNDSGLRRSTATLDGDIDKMSPVKEAQSMLSMCSTNTVDSVIYRPKDGEKLGSPISGKKSHRGPPPPPPRRTSSMEVCEKIPEIDGSSSGGSNSTLNEGSKDGNKGLDSSFSESDQETIYARLKTKTRISSGMYPSWCSVSDEDSTPESSREKLMNSHKNANGIASKLSPFEGSFSGQHTVMMAGQSLSLNNPTSVGLSGKGEEMEWEGHTLPKRYTVTKGIDEDDFSTNSWPRSGILKRDKSPNSKTQKTLNFAPMVNMFDPKSPEGVQLPLPDMSSSSSDETKTSANSLTSASDDGSAYKLAIPLGTPETVKKQHGRIPMKYQPIITVKPRPRSAVEPSKKTGAYVNLNEAPQNQANCQVVYPTTVIKPSTSSTPITKTPFRNRSASCNNRVRAHYASTDIMSQSSGSSSSIPSLSSSSEGGYMDMRSATLRSNQSDTLSSSSSIALSDIDSGSLTYVSMSSASSTPTNSTLTLTQDSGSDTSLPLSGDTQRTSNRTFGSGNPVKSDVRNVSVVNGPKVSSPPMFSSFTGPDTRSFTSSLSPSPTVEAPRTSMHRSSTSPIISGGSGAPSSYTSSKSSSSLPHSSTWPSGTPGHQAKSPHQSTPIQATTSQSSSALRPSVLAVSPIQQTGRPQDRRRSAPLPGQSPSTAYSQGSPSSVRSADSSSSSSSRSDSYRVAMKTEYGQNSPTSARADSYRVAVSRTNSAPATAEQEYVNRADSYRVAVRNTNGVVDNSHMRNTSYRVALKEGEKDSRMEALNSWDGKGKDIRRMCITDIDQLKCYSDDDSTKKMKEKSGRGHFATINSSKKKVSSKSDLDSLLKPNKTPSPDISNSKKTSKAEKEKDKKKSKDRSSTYIRFDPIFEDKEDYLNSSSDTLRASTSSLRPLSEAHSSENLANDDGPLLGKRLQAPLPVSKHRGSNGKKPVDEKAVMSILDSIKSTIKSISGKSPDKEEDHHAAFRYGSGV